MGAACLKATPCFSSTARNHSAECPANMGDLDRKNSDLSSWPRSRAAPSSASATLLLPHARSATRHGRATTLAVTQHPPWQRATQGTLVARVVGTRHRQRTVPPQAVADVHDEAVETVHYRARIARLPLFGLLHRCLVSGRRRRRRQRGHPTEVWVAHRTIMPHSLEKFAALPPNT